MVKLNGCEPEHLELVLEIFRSIDGNLHEFQIHGTISESAMGTKSIRKIVRRGLYGRSHLIRPLGT
jgi:hypothetical protein